MSETDTSRETLEQVIEPIRSYIAEVKGERDRYRYIAATIRVNAMRHGATEDQIEAFLSGKQSFITWMIEQIEDADKRALLARAEKAEADRDEWRNQAKRYKSQVISLLNDRLDGTWRDQVEQDAWNDAIEWLLNPPEEYCAKCGAPKSDHPYRHPFQPAALKGQDQ